MTSPIVITSTITLELPYTGWAISKNGLWNAGDRRKGMNKEAVAWKATLVEWLQHYPFFHMRQYIILPVGVEIGARCRDRSHAPDTQNLVELVADAIEAALGVDDKDFDITTHPPQLGTSVPVVLVTVRVRMEV